MPTYEFTGDLPVVFIGIRNPETGHTWTPSKGDRIVLDEPVGNPLLALVAEALVEETPKAAAKKIAAVENPESAATADDNEEN